MRILLILALAVGVVSTGYAMTVREFMSAVTNDKNPKEAENALIYFNGVLDTTMAMGERFRLRLWCFPRPIPSRTRLNQEFIADLGQLALEIGEAKAFPMQIDAALINRWSKRYPCN